MLCPERKGETPRFCCCCQSKQIPFPAIWRSIILQLPAYSRSNEILGRKNCVSIAGLCQVLTQTRWVTLHGAASALVPSARDAGRKPAFLLRYWWKTSLFPTCAFLPGELVPTESGTASPRENSDEGGDPGADGHSVAAGALLASVTGGTWCDGLLLS